MFKKLYFPLIIAIIGILIGMLIGLRFLCPKEKEESLTSRTVLERVSEQAFLVTRSVVVNQEANKTVENGSWWSELWYKDEVRAQAIIEADIGVDLSKLEEEDITVDKDDKILKITLPETEVRNVSLKDDIRLETESGIITAFTRDKDDDYNEAIKKLKDEVKKSVEEDTELNEEARDAVIDILQAIFDDTDYEVKLVESEE